ncbi:MAG: hypothetical protein LBU90_10420 [Bacteroidales bacterium]|jgi:hypothetical protein|nr:hypothetical protein [Bacteroidales bacterium]
MAEKTEKTEATIIAIDPEVKQLLIEIRDALKAQQEVPAAPKAAPLKVYAPKPKKKQ